MSIQKAPRNSCRAYSGPSYKAVDFQFNKVTLELNILSYKLMEMAQEWFSELETESHLFMTGDEIKNSYGAIGNISVHSFSSVNYTENMRLVDQSVQIQQQENKPPHYEQSNSIIHKSSETPEPLIAATLPSSNTFTISFANISPNNEILRFSDSLGRNNTQAQDHVLAERRRRERLNKHFISLSALCPNLKKMDKASVLEDAASYIKQLQDRVNELEGLLSPKRKFVEECVTSKKRSRISNSDEEHSSIEETEFRENTNICISSPEIEVRVLGSSVLIRIHCKKKITSLTDTLIQIQKLGLSVISSSAMPFAKTTTLITIAAQIEDDFSMTTKELLKNLQLAI
ncbi:transcription factor bHLH18-like [Bidens hawaiensis]|uniref:transcription factor bHLH18-like n=1 Tax=Bidens hawaiensis TaxID=980011 RepID=UPI00404A50D6